MKGIKQYTLNNKTLFTLTEKENVFINGYRVFSVIIREEINILERLYCSIVKAQ